MKNPTVGFCPTRTQGIMQVLQREVDSQRLPGAVALIAHQGQVLLHAAVGQQDPAQGIAMSVDSIFRIYSMTKPVVSVAVMMLLEEGKLLLSDPVAKHLPEFAGVQVAHREGAHTVLRPPQSPPTVHDLLRHTAGLSYEIMGSEPIQRQYVEAKLGSPQLTNTEFSHKLAAIPLMFEPGSVWEYSRATDLLGALVERISGQTLGAFLQQRIFDPLGMVDTGFAVPPDQQHRIAEPFAMNPDGGPTLRLMDVRKPAASQGGGAGLVSTVGDYARFLQSLQGGTRLLSPATIRFMTADHLGSIGVHRQGPSGELLPPGHGFGLGFAVRTSAGVADAQGSPGMYFWGGISGTTFFVDPVHDFFAVMMIQAPGQRDYYRPLFRNLVYAALRS